MPRRLMDATECHIQECSILAPLFFFLSALFHLFTLLEDPLKNSDFLMSKLFIIRIVFLYFDAEPALCLGDSVYLVGLSKTLRAKSRKSVVTNPCGTINTSAERPRYRATNMEVIELDSGKRLILCFPSFALTMVSECLLCCISDFGHEFTGLLCNGHGKVQAIWASFSNKVRTVNLLLVICFVMVACTRTESSFS